MFSMSRELVFVPIPLAKHFPGSSVTFFSVDFGEGGVEGFGDLLEAVFDAPTGG